MSEKSDEIQDDQTIKHLKDVHAKVEEDAYKLSENLQSLSVAKPYVDNVCTSLIAFISEALRKLQGEGTADGKLTDAMVALGTVSQFANNYVANHTRQMYNIEGQLIEKKNVTNFLMESIASEKSRAKALQRVKESDESGDDLDSRSISEHPEKITVIREHKSQKDQS